MGGMWVFIVIFLGLAIFKKVSKSMDVFSDDFPPVGNDSGSSQAEGQDVQAEVQDVQPKEEHVRPEVRNAQSSDTVIEKPSEQPQPAPKAVSSAQRLFGLIGKPLGHSKSEQLFKDKFKREHINADYCNFELESIEDLPGIISANPNLCGFNVTIPYKEAVIPYMDELDESASAVGAVNAVKVIRNGESARLVGYNTDCIGFMESIKEHVGDRKKALILGTGGVSKAVKHAFDLLGIESRYVSRSSSFDILGYYELSPSILDEYTVIVNCTPVGMHPNNDQCPDIPYSFLSAEHLIYDVIYNPQETLFMKKSREYGATAIGGEKMFELQAAASWNIWNGQD